MKILLTEHEYDIVKAAWIRGFSIGLTSSGAVTIVLSIFYFVQLRGMPVPLYEAALPLVITVLFVGMVLLILGIALWNQIEVKEESEDVVFV